MNLILIASSSVLSIMGLMGLGRTATLIADRRKSIDLRFSHMANQIKEYQERYVQPVDSFLFKWSREPGQDNDFEIVQWCKDHDVRYAYKLDQTASYKYPKDCFEVWILDPRLAMEFKLRFY